MKDLYLFSPFLQDKSLEIAPTEGNHDNRKNIGITTKRRHPHVLICDDKEGKFVNNQQILRWSRTFHYLLCMLRTYQQKSPEKKVLHFKRIWDLVFYHYLILSDVNDFCLWLCQVLIPEHLRQVYAQMKESRHKPVNLRQNSISMNVFVGRFPT